jgi:hypothetical protein
MLNLLPKYSNTSNRGSLIVKQEIEAANHDRPAKVASYRGIIRVTWSIMRGIGDEANI